MPVIDQIDVRILVDGQPLAEYQDPEAAPETNRQRNRYIEVKTGQQFKIQVQLLPGFKLQWAKHIYYTCHIDQIGTHWYNDLSPTTMKHYKGVLSHPYSSVIDGLQLRNDKTGIWEFCPPIFGALGFADNDRVEDASKLTPEDVKAIGSIRIVVYRATAKKLDVPKYYSGIREFIPDELSERMLKGLDVKNNIKFPNGNPCNAPDPTTHDYLPLPGPPGDQYTINFFYRSRKVLQNLGCIPRSPSPQPDPALMLERTEDMLKLAKQQQRESNLRILQLQEQLERASSGSRDNSVKSESLGGSTVTEGRSRSVTVDLTGSNINIEPGIEMVEPPLASDRTQRTRPIPPLFSATATTKRGRDEKHEDDNAVIKRARLAAETPMPSVEGQAAGKRKRGDDEAEKDDLVELPPQPKRPQVVEVVDLTDD